LKVIPVIDILNGIVVHAVRGERDKYSPLKSVLCESADPVDVARVLRATGFSELYIADLDAITGRTINQDALRRIRAETSSTIMVDAGINTIEKARGLLKLGVSNIVIGTETLSDLRFIKRALEIFGVDRVIVSIDILENKILSLSVFIKSYKPIEFAKFLEGAGVTKAIILDLKRVGSEEGPNLTLVKEVIGRTNLEVYVGGGIRNIMDLEELRRVGVSKALIATALHKGIITPQALKDRSFLL
jgi:phosphoribosylformimino-5-aminoimidazole carboxamide ribotide isomerase